MKKKVYEAPVIKSESMLVGVFGCYGSDSHPLPCFLSIGNRKKHKPCS